MRIFFLCTVVIFFDQSEIRYSEKIMLYLLLFSCKIFFNEQIMWLLRAKNPPPPPFLAHLSRRLTRWAYSIAMVRHPSVVVRRRPHFQTCISLKPAGQPRSNFMCSITGVGERLHKVLGQIRSKPWFPWQQKAPHWLIMGKTMSPPFLGCFWSDLFYTCR